MDAKARKAAEKAARRRINARHTRLEDAVPDMYGALHAMLANSPREDAQRLAAKLTRGARRVA